MYFYDNGHGTLEDNDIFNHLYSGVQIRLVEFSSDWSTCCSLLDSVHMTLLNILVEDLLIGLHLWLSAGQLLCLLFFFFFFFFFFFKPQKNKGIQAK